MKKNKAIFLDRDGTIIKDVEFLIKPEQFKILPGVAKAVAEFNCLGFLVIVITNQPVVSWGVIDPKGIENLHRILIDKFAKKGAKIDAFYFCPHHPASKIPEWGINCRCRKPKAGMILRAIKDFNIDRKKSFMIGDALIDVLAGQRAGLKTIQVKTGPGHPRLDKIYKDTKPDFVVRNLKEAVKRIKTIIKK